MGWILFACMKAIMRDVVNVKDENIAGKIE